MQIIKKEDYLKKEVSNQELTSSQWYIFGIQIIKLVTLCLPFIALSFITVTSFFILLLSLLGIINPAFSLICILLGWCLRQMAFLLRRSADHLFPEENKPVSEIDKVSTTK